MHTLALCLALAAPLPIADTMRTVKFAASGAICTTNTTAPCKILNAVAANANASLRTFVLPVAGYSKATIQVNLTRSAATDIQLACTASLDGGATYATITSTSILAGVGTMTAYHDVYATTSTGNVLFEYDTRTYDSMTCVWSSTSGGSNDKATVYAGAAVGQ